MVHVGASPCTPAARDTHSEALPHDVPQDDEVESVAGKNKNREQAAGHAPAQSALTALFTVDERKLLRQLVLAARRVHLRRLQPGNHNWGVMALIITADVIDPVNGWSRRQPWHVDVFDGHAISLVYLLSGRRPAQYVLPGQQPSLRDALLQMGISANCIEEALQWCNMSSHNYLGAMLASMLPVLQRRSPVGASDPFFTADWGHQIVMEHLVVHRGMDCRADEPRIALFLTSTDVSTARGGSYDPDVQYIRYQFPLALFRLEAALYWLYKDRVDVPRPGDTFGAVGPLSKWLNDFVAEAAAADIANGRTCAERRRDHEPDDTWLELKARELAPFYLAYVSKGAGAILGGELFDLRRMNRFPPTWAKHYFDNE